MPRSRYIVGIDLGTTNCAVGYVDTKGRERPSADIKVFEVPQLVAPGETAQRPMLPSFVYLPGAHELPPGAAALPWEPDATRIVGEFARAQGARIPSRLVSSAKSWLCHAGVDREAEILPWGSPAEIPKLSPVDAAATLLKHIRDAWNATFAASNEAARLQDQEVVLTVPASFDEAARELTIEAAKRAGFERLTLLEEPQAAFYCWIVSHSDRWQSEVRGGELILVCDIGGGTTDFSLITVVETPNGPGFRRVAVGDHLMLGGDNLDLTLAHRVETKLGGARLDGEQWSALRFSCRVAKEKMLADETLARWPLTIAGRGSKLIGGGIQSELTRDEVRDVVLDGFLPLVPADAEPNRGGRSGLLEFGLPFVNDPAISKHLASFLRRQGESSDRPARPDAILFNGGALAPAVVRERIVEIVRIWFTTSPDDMYRPRVLANESLDLAVAIGAAYYGVVRRGGGIRIGGGTARSIYVGFENAEKQRRWLCVVPRDAQEGEEIAITSREFDLLTGQPVAFPLAGSSVRANDQAGDVVDDDPATILELPPLVSVMRVGRKAKAETVPVDLHARVTEIGTIELWCQSRRDPRRWGLQIQVRPGEKPASGGPAPVDEDAAVIIEQSELDAALEEIRVAFATYDPHDAKGVATLVKRLETTLDAPRDSWPSSALRTLWEPLKESLDARAKSPQHEVRWLNLAGYCLRPGTGYPLDDTRMKALWPVFHAGVKHPKEKQCWTEWWILWRRVSAGLNKAHQNEIARRLIPFLVAKDSGKKSNRPKPERHELSEMWRLAASLERLPAEQKTTFGDRLIRELKPPHTTPSALWSIGRLGARTTLYGPANTVVSREAAERWMRHLLTLNGASPRETSELIFALSQIARLSGDRARDLEPGLREAVVARLQTLGAEESQILPVREFQEMGQSQQAQAFGEALPVGLRLIVSEEAS